MSDHADTIRDGGEQARRDHDEIMAFAREHGLAAALDHIEQDGLGNLAAALAARCDALEREKDDAKHWVDEYRDLAEQFKRERDKTDASRFAQFSKRERMTMHVALRMLAKFPDEAGAATPLADEIWNEHAAALAGERQET
jgi:hypothetical protein